MARRTYSDAERDEARARDRDLVERAARELLTSDGWMRWAETRARFHRYSFGNCMMIAAQYPDASHVAGFHTWRDLGRHVRKGERGIRIYAPMSVKDRESDDPNAKRTLFRVVPVFDIAQTDGEPLPEPPSAPVTGESHVALLPALEAYARSLGYTVDVEPLADGVGGYCNATAKRIVTSASVAGNARVRVLIHEIAHALGVGYREYGREVAEVIVETVTVIVCKRAGLDTTGASIPYIAGWGEQDLDAIRAHAAKVDEIARALEAVVDRVETSSVAVG